MLQVSIIVWERTLVSTGSRRGELTGQNYRITNDLHNNIRLVGGLSSDWTRFRPSRSYRLQTIQ